MTKDEITSIVDLLVSPDDTSVKVGLNLLAYQTGYVIHEVLRTWVERIYDNFTTLYNKVSYYIMKSQPRSWGISPSVIIQYPELITDPHFRVEIEYDNQDCHNILTLSTIIYYEEALIISLCTDEEIANKFRNLLKLILEHGTT
jgi:hypothetical protein